MHATPELDEEAAPPLPPAPLDPELELALALEDVSVELEASSPVELDAVDAVLLALEPPAPPVPVVTAW
jgi:hypothetical protein